MHLWKPSPYEKTKKVIKTVISILSTLAGTYILFYLIVTILNLKEVYEILSYIPLDPGYVYISTLVLYFGMTQLLVEKAQKSISEEISTIKKELYNRLNNFENRMLSMLRARLLLGHNSNYRRALELSKAAKKRLVSTYFLKVPRKTLLRKEVEERLKTLSESDEEAIELRYRYEVSNHIIENKVDFRWIYGIPINIADEDKWAFFESLCKRVHSSFEAMTKDEEEKLRELIIKRKIKIGALPFTAEKPLLPNFLIVDEECVLIGFPDTSYARLEHAIEVSDSSIAEFFEDYFNDLWLKAFVIVDDKIYLDKIYELAKKLGIDMNKEYKGEYCKSVSECVEKIRQNLAYLGDKYFSQ